MVRLNILFCVFILFLTGCYTMYIPVLPNTSLFKNRNEFQSEASINPDGFYGKLAYSPIKHVGININGHYFYNSPLLFGSIHKDFHEYIDGSLGYYANYNKKLFFEIYFGYGYGKSRMHLSFDEWDNYLYSYDRGLYNKLYGQINLALESKSGNQFGLTNRYGYISYTLDESAFRWLGTEKILHTTWEPSLFYVKKLSNKLRLTFYTGLVFVSGEHNNEGEPTIIVNKLSAGVGLKLVLGRKDNKE